MVNSVVLFSFYDFNSLFSLTVIWCIDVSLLEAVVTVGLLCCWRWCSLCYIGWCLVLCAGLRGYVLVWVLVYLLSFSCFIRLLVLGLLLWLWLIVLFYLILCLINYCCLVCVVLLFGCYIFLCLGFCLVSSWCWLVCLVLFLPRAYVLMFVY